MAKLIRDLSKPPSRMAELFVAASDASRLSKMPDAGYVVYHGTNKPFLGPPTPRKESYGWEFPGVFVTNDAVMSIKYMGIPSGPHDDIRYARRMFKTRLDPQRIFRVQWPGGVQVGVGMGPAQEITNQSVWDEVKRYSEDRDAGFEAFRERYDAVMPPPYIDWGTLGDKRWQAIMLNPQFGELTLFDPAMDDFNTTRSIHNPVPNPYHAAMLLPVDLAVKEYARHGGEGYEWARDIVKRGQSIVPNPDEPNDLYNYHPYYEDYQARSEYLARLKGLARRGALSETETTAMNRYRQMLGVIMPRIAPKRAKLSWPDI